MPLPTLKVSCVLILIERDTRTRQQVNALIVHRPRRDSEKLFHPKRDMDKTFTKSAENLVSTRGVSG